MIPGELRGGGAYCLCRLIGRNDSGMTGPVKGIKTQSNQISEC
jgi:hypothetical protein